MIQINKEGYDGFTLDIEIYKEYGTNFWAQAHYLVHGIDDVLWTNSIEEALSFLRENLERIK